MIEEKQHALSQHRAMDLTQRFIHAIDQQIYDEEEA
jgi:hypothetical protein